MKRIDIYEQGQSTRTPSYKTYESIRRYLTLRSGETDDQLFADFILEVFTSVFSDMDVDRETKEGHIERLRQLDLNIKDNSLAEIRDALKVANISWDKLLAAAQELIRPDEDRLLSQVSKLEHSIQKFVDLADEGTR